MHIPFISFICFSIFLGLFGGPQAARRCRKSYPSLVLTSDITLCPCLFLHLSLHSGIYVRFQYFVLHFPLSLQVSVWLHSPDSCEHAYLIWLCLWVFPPFHTPFFPGQLLPPLMCLFKEFLLPLVSFTWSFELVSASIRVVSVSVRVCPRTYRIFRFFMGLLNCFM